MRLSPFLFLMVCAAGPGGASPPERVANGAWGGEHVRLTVHDDGGTIEFDCAHGTLDKPLTLDARGRFEVPGSLVAEGGPLLKDEVATCVPGFSSPRRCQRPHSEIIKAKYHT